jgi:hypothetical protein
MRPPTLGPRSSTLQVVDSPLAVLVTVSTVPNAMLGLAQVPAGAWYHEACPLSWFCEPGGAVLVVLDAGGTVVVVVVVVGGGGSVVVVVVGGGGSYLAATTGTEGSVEVVVEATDLMTSAARTTSVFQGVLVPAVAAARAVPPVRTWRARVACSAGIAALRACTFRGFDNRRSGTTTKALQSPSLTASRNPPALCVLRSPPFPLRTCIQWRRDRVRT